MFIFNSPLVFIFSAGYFQTPGWDGKTTYPSYMDSWARVVVPAHHWIMVSYDIDMLFSPRCRKEKITLYTGNASTAATTITAEVAEEELHRLFGLCSSDNCPTLIHTEVLHVHFVSGERDSGTPKTGFRVFFSFHNQSALLQEVSYCKWNCSVPFWPDYQHHFPCNAISECVGHEDEAKCPYTSEACGAGKLSAGGGCYTYHYITVDDYTWEDVARRCRAMGARLATLNSPDQWTDILIALGMRSEFYSVYIGLSTTSSALHHMWVSLRSSQDAMRCSAL